MAHDRAGQPAVGHGQPPPRDLRPHDTQHGDAAQAHSEQVSSRYYISTQCHLDDHGNNNDDGQVHHQPPLPGAAL